MKVLSVVAMALMLAGCDPGPSVSLVRTEWDCTQTKKYNYTTFMMIGKVMVPQVHVGTRCVQYTRNVK